MDRILVTVHTTDPLSRDGVARQLGYQPGITVLDRSVTATGADGHEVAVVVMDKVDEQGLTELRRVSRRNGRRVVLIAGELREPELVAVLECRVQAILWRHEASGDRLASAVRSAAKGGSDLPPDIVTQLLDLLGRLRREPASAAAASTPTTFALVEREISVLRLVSEGLETREIADKLAYSERTIKNILHGLMTRLRLKNRAHAVAYALREGHI
jgi:DNA-binding NarL/FixJ family response regulator